MAVIISELVWVPSFLAFLGIFHNHSMKLFSNSQAALHIAKNPICQERIKYIEIDSHFVREKLIAGLLSLIHVTSQHQPIQPADIFTKALEKRQF